MSENPPRLVRDVDDDEHDLDHDEEPARPARRRRRPVADWGVGDDMFEHMPRRRFPHTTEGPARDRRAPARDESTPAPRRSRARARRPAEPDIPRGAAPDGRRTIQIGSDEDVPSEIAALTADRDLGDDDGPGRRGAPRASARGSSPGPAAP